MKLSFKELISTVRESLKKPEGEEARGLSHQELSLFGEFLRPLKLIGILSLITAAASALLGSALPLGGKALVDFVIMKRPTGGLPESMGRLIGSFEGLLLVVLLAAALIGLLGLAQRYLTFVFRQELSYGIKRALFERILGFPITFFKKRGSGYLISRLSDDVAAMDGVFAYGLPQLAAGAFQLAFGTALLSLIDLRLALLIAAVIPLYIAMTRFFAIRMRGVAMREMETGAQVTKAIGEALTGVETVMAHSAEQREVEKVSGRMRTVIDARLRGTVLSTLSHALTRLLQLLVLALALSLGTREVTRGAMTGGDLAAMAAYLVFLSRAAGGVSVSLMALQSAVASMRRISELFGIADGGVTARDKSIYSPKEMRGEIVFNNVSFKYEGADIEALKDVSFSVKRGEILALVGPSGAGKTTAVNLLLKFYRPGGGTITLDGTDINEIPARWLRERTGAVSQDVFLFNDTVENNIKYGNPDALDGAVREAARRAGIEDDIASLPEGYGTAVGERGASLSAGQRQRLSIARAILKDPPILIFDEPASALDPRTERQLMDSIRSLAAGRTVIIVAHSLGFVRMADRIVVLKEGRVAETGAHDVLIRKGGLYSALFSSSASGGS